MLRTLATIMMAAAPTIAVPVTAQAQASPAEVVQALLAADRSFSEGARERDVAEGIGAMLHPDARTATPDMQWALGRDAAVATLRANPANAGARASWTPIRGGVSADGRHGFTYGYMTITPREGAPRYARYLSYWVRTPEGWRVLAYRRTPHAAAPAATAMREPSLPRLMTVPATSGDAERVTGLRAAEQGFSDLAQRIGLGPAFTQMAAEDAILIGAGAPGDFVHGPQAIGAAIGSPAPPSPVHWNADEAVVASSGDLGVTFGFVRSHDPQAGRPAAFPFFTVWRRDADGRWRYLAE